MVRTLRLSCVLALLFTEVGYAQAFYDWVGQGFWDGRTYEGYNAYSSAEIAYSIASFRGPDNATLTDSDPGTCGEAPTGLNQVCQFTTSYFVQSSGATPTITGFMRSFGYGFWLGAPTSHRQDVCVNDCVVRRAIPAWALALFPQSRMRVPFRKEDLHW
jgi:hypothetical protein